jgi:hypothetical protein
MRYKLWIWTMARLIPSDYLRLMLVGEAFEKSTSRTAADELLEQVSDGREITWADWMRIGRRAGLSKPRHQSEASSAGSSTTQTPPTG